MREAASLLAEKNPELRNPNAKIKFRALTCISDRPLKYKLRTLGTLYNYEQLPDDNTTLGYFKFAIGDGMVVTVVSSDHADNHRRRDTYDTKGNGSWVSTHNSRRQRYNDYNRKEVGKNSYNDNVNNKYRSYLHPGQKSSQSTYWSSARRTYHRNHRGNSRSMYWVLN